jgi:Family of unknown function (DUF6326)
MNTTIGSPLGTNSTTTQMEYMKASLSTVWIYVMFNMVFADIFSFMYPGALQQIMAGNADVTPITPEFLLIAAIVTEIPIAMVFLSRLLKYEANRWVNIIGGVITILWVVGMGSPTLTYVFFAAIEVACALVIIGKAWLWKSAIEPSTGN